MTRAEQAEAAAWRSAEVMKIAADLRRVGVNAGSMVARYRDGATIKEIAADFGCPWPTVHVAIFDLRRCGINIPRRVRA